MKKRLLSVIVLLGVFFFFTPVPYAYAVDAIAFDTAGTNTTGGTSASSLTTSITLTGSNIFFVVNAGSTRTNVTGCTGISATWNGVSMTATVSDQRGGTWAIGTLYLANAASGTHDLVVTPTGCIANTHIGVAYASYNTAKATGQPDSIADINNGGGTTNLSTSVTLSAVNGWSIAAAGNDNNRTITNSSNVTNIRATLSMTDPGSGETQKLIVGDGGVIASAGSYTQSVSFSANSDTNNLSLFAIIPPAAAAGATFNFWQLADF